MFNDDINMEFRFDKCAKTILTKRKLVHSQNLILDINCDIQELEKGRSYQHTGTE
jgi:hypothetical protein